MFAPDPSTPTVYPVIPITLITDTKEGTFDANLLAKVNLLAGAHQFLAGVDYDWTHFYSGMGLGANANTVGTIDLANPVYTLVFASQTPPNYIEDDHKTLAGYVQDQATYARLHLTVSLRYTQLKFLETSNYGVANYSTYRHVSPRAGGPLISYMVSHFTAAMRPRSAPPSASLVLSRPSPRHRPTSRAG